MEVIEGYRLSPQQKRLWLHRDSSARADLTCAIRIDGPLDHAMLDRAFDRLVERHEILRTSFERLPGMELPVQVINGHNAGIVEKTIEPRGDNQHELQLKIAGMCADVWSIGNIVSELARLYEARSLEEAIQYTQLSEWQNELLDSHEDEDREGRQYWLAQKGKLPLPIKLPWESGSNGVSRSLSWTMHARDVQALADREGASLETVLLACWQTLLWRLTGQAEIVVETSFAGRKYEEMHEAIGAYATYLPIVATIEEGFGFSDLLRQVALTCDAAQKRQEYFSSELMYDATPSAGIGFSYGRWPAPARVNGLALSVADLESGRSGCKLELECLQRGGELLLRLHYDEGRYGAVEIERLREQFERLLESVLVQPKKRLRWLEVLSAGERRLIEEWSGSRSEYASERCVHELFEAQVERTPDVAAVKYEGEEISYRELNERADELAWQLRELGVGPETVVGLCLERSVEMLVGVLGILKAGGVYLPLEPMYPQARIAFMLEDAQARVLVTQRALSERFEFTSGTKVCVEELLPQRRKGAKGELPRDVNTENLAYIIYTSGSTGRPKGVMVRHGAVVNLQAALQRAIYSELPDGMRVSVNAPVSFDASVKQIVQLLAGHTLVIVPEDLRLDAAQLLEWLRSEELDVLDCTPVQLRLLLDAGLQNELKALLIGGEAIDQLLWERLAALTATRSYNVYGPTECTVDATAKLIAGSLPTLGQALPNTQVYVLGTEQEMLPLGVAGELYLGGVGVARGYLGQANLTAERFVPHPFSIERGARLYRTGDLVRWTTGGELEYLGRADEQVKIRGNRLELGEVAATLGTHESVRECVVIAREDEPGHKRLVAYVVPRQLMHGQAHTRQAEWREHLRARLPEYMVPSAFVLLDRLPLSANGKIDRRALPPPEEVHVEEENSTALTLTPVEEMLANIWSEVLHVTHVNANDNFFDLGGHSLLATQLISRIREVFAIELPLRTLFELPVLSPLAMRIEETMRADVGVQTPPLQPVERDAATVLSFAQQRLWFLDQLEPNSTFYNSPMAVRLSGELKKDALQQTLTEIVRRHEVLRTTFPNVDGHALQVVAEPAPVQLPETDISELASDEREAEIMRFAREDAATPFDLSRGPLLRFRLLRVGPLDHVVLMSMHHIVCDGWSLGLLTSELATIYTAYYEGRESPLPELEVQYGDFANWQRSWLQGEALETQLRYWQEQLRGAATLELPTDRIRPALPSHRGASHSFELPAEVSDGVRKLSRRAGTTLFMTLLAATQTLLSRYSGQTDIVVGTPIAGRTRREIEPLIGFFINTLVLRSEVRSEQSFLELLSAVRETSLRAHAHQDIPFEKLVDELQPERDLSRSPLFQVMFTLQNAASGDALELPGLAISGVGAESVTAKFDLDIGFSEGREGQLRCSFVYATDLFEEATIVRMGQHMARMLAAIVESPSQKIHELSLLTPHEEAQFLAWNATAAQYQQHSAIHELFEEQVLRTPDAPALSFEDEQLTYAELNERANQLAHHLRSLGVDAEEIVGVRLDRGIEMVISLLAVFKSGGGYLPIDPSYPSDRVAFMLEDAAARVVLTTTELMRGLETSIPSQIVCLDQEWERLAELPLENPSSSVRGDNLAYVIYTSGSTGRPKGVMAEHRHLLNTINSSLQQFSFGNNDVMPVLASFAFDISLFELLVPLSAGACALVVSKDEVLEPARLLARLQQATMVHGVPSLMAQLVEVVRNSNEHALRQLRLIFTGGEAVPSVLLEALREQMPQADVRVLYGPTEATIICATHEVSEVSAGKTMIGRAMGNVKLRIVDANGHDVPVGVRGEIWIGGAGVTRGYLGRPELTAEKFVNENGERYYRTGDLGRYLPNGELEYLGRADEQVKIRGYRIELGEVQAALAANENVRECAVIAREDDPGHKRLVAYVVAEGKADAVALRESLRVQLPDYMVPSAFVFMDQLPLTSNGKLDRRALPAPDASSLSQSLQFIPPRTEVEATLSRIWGEVLGLQRVGIHDNFFDLGGDSILSIQIISKAATAGLRLTAKQLFQHQTIAALAQLPEVIAAGDANASWAEQGMVTGPVALTPIQRWFFSQERVNPDHFNQAVMLRVSADVEVIKLREALTALVAHHDALRLRFTRDDEGQWQQFNAAVDDELVSVHEVELSGVDEVTAFAEEVQRSLSLAGGPLMRAVLMRLGTGHEPRLLIVVHHLVVDGVSWRILLADLQAAYEQARRGEVVQLPAKTSSFQQWAASLTDYAASERLLEDARYWREQPWEQAGRLPLDHEGGRNRRRDVRHTGVQLSQEQTTWLLQDAPAAYRTRIQELLLTALATVLGEWMGSEAVVVDLEGHGREEAIADVTRTVGWFTTIYPVLLRDVSSQRRNGATEGVGELIKSLKEQLRAVPEGGLGYGVQRYLRADGEQAVKAEVVFNYLGQLDQVLAGERAESTSKPVARLIAGMAPESSGDGEDPDAERGHLLEINGGVAGGQFGLRWSYSAEQFKAETIERVAQRYQEELLRIIEHCRDEEAGGRTPSDFPLARLTQTEVDQIAGNGRAIEDVYATTPLQQGMLFQTLVDQHLSGLFGQSNYLIEGGLDVPAFLNAAQEVVNRQPILRTAFVWEDVSTPVQVVHRNVSLPVVQLDWRELSEPEQLERWERLRVEDQQRGFELDHAPLMRVTLARTGDETYWLLWSHHHLLLDGWCLALVIKELFAAYARQLGVEVAEDGTASRPYRDYVEWLQQQDLSQAEHYWRETLSGFSQPTVLALGRRPRELNAEALYGDRHVHLTLDQSRRLQGRARREQVTINTVLQGAWALMLARYSGQRDVVFGATVSGRPAELQGVEEMIGLFINTLPVRVNMNEEQGVWEWLRELQQQQLEMRQYEYTSIAQVQQWSEASAGRGLFDTLLVYENYPYQVEQQQGRGNGGGGLRIRKASQPVQTKYPLTLVGGMGAELVVYLSYQRRRYSDEQIEVLSAQLEKVLAQLGDEQEWKLDQALVTGEWERQARAEFEAEEQEAQAQREAETADESPVLELVRKAISEVLGGVAVGNNDNFFELGGHSLLATQLVSRIRELFGIDLPLRVLFEMPVLSLLAARIEEELRLAAGVAAPPLTAMERGTEVPLSFAQQRLWFLDQLEPNSPFYNYALAVRLKGALNRTALDQTLTEIVRRHEVLRTSFVSSGGRPVQVIAEATPIRLVDVDLSEFSGTELEPTVQRLAHEEAKQPFDLSRGPLLRFKLLRLAELDHVVLMTTHHIISDGWSTGVFINEVATLYRAYYEGCESPLPELEVQYADYSLWQRGWLQGEALDRQMGYWEEQLRGVATLELPVDKERPAVPTHRGARHSFAVGAEVSAAIKDLSRREGATLFMTLLAAFQALLSRYSGQQDIVVGTVVAGRNRQQLEPLIGLFINTLALRTNLSGDPSFKELLRRVREVCLGAYAHQDVPFEKLVEELQPERDTSRSPVFQVTFGMQNAPQGTLELPGLQLQALNTENEQSRFDLTVWLMERDGQLFGTMTYNTDILEEDTIRIMRLRYATLLESIARNPDARLSVLEIISQQEKEEQVSRKQKRRESHMEKMKSIRRRAATAPPEVTQG